MFIDELPQYRVSFFDGARAYLSKHGVQFDLIVSQFDQQREGRGDEAHLGWERRVKSRYVRVGPISAVWQPVLHDIYNCDLAIIAQENRRLVNYPAQMFRGFGKSRIALWGHGRNFQAAPGFNLAESWKRIWATRCDWWFAYTEGTGKLIEGYGFPSDRITVFHNAIDTSQLRRWGNEINADELVSLRRQLGIVSDNVAVYVGGLYNFKRIAFLLDAAKEIRRRIPDFHLIIAGGGIDSQLIVAAAATNPWIHYVGPRFGRDKAAIIRLGRVLVMPGAVGLAILDGSALSVPMVTTAYPFHGPEIAYLESGENGLMVGDWQNVAAYADAVVSVLCDSRLQAKLAAGARKMADAYTIERMVKCFSDGVLAALLAKRRL